MATINLSADTLRTLLTTNPSLLTQLLADNPSMKVVINNPAAEAPPTYAPPAQTNSPPGGVDFSSNLKIWSNIVEATPRTTDGRPDRLAVFQTKEVDEYEEECEEPFNYKTELCMYFKQGWCSQGENCNYAHGKQELREKPKVQYKTAMCRYYQTNSCKNGMNCRFAHSHAELR